MSSRTSWQLQTCGLRGATEAGGRGLPASSARASAAGWALALLQQGSPAAALGRALLAGSPRPPAPVAARSPQVCSCHDVREDSIRATLARCGGTPVERLRSVQAQLRCGTECGSCVPALQALVRDTIPAPAARPPLPLQETTT